MAPSLSEKLRRVPDGAGDDDRRNAPGRPLLSGLAIPRHRPQDVVVERLERILTLVLIELLRVLLRRALRREPLLAFELRGAHGHSSLRRRVVPSFIELAITVSACVNGGGKEAK